MTVRPSSTAASDCSRCRAARGSSSEVASSSTSVCGSARTSRASATCCACGGREPRARPCRPRCPGRRAAPRPSPSRRRPPAPPTAASSSASRRGQQQVVAQRADEDVVLLGDQGDVAAHRLRGQLGRARPRPSRCVPVRGRCSPASSRPRVDLPAPDGPTMAMPLPGCDVEVDAVQHVATLAVAEADVAGDDLGRRRARRVVGLRVGHLVHAEQPGERRLAHLQLVVPHEDQVDRLDEHLGVQHRGGDLREVDLAVRRRASRRGPAPRPAAARRRSRPRGRTPYRR